MTIINAYALNITATKYINQIQKYKKEEMDNNILIQSFNIPMDRSSRKKFSRETLDLKCTLDQTDITEMYRTFHPRAVEYTFFSSAHKTFFRTGHMLHHKRNLASARKLKS